MAAHGDDTDPADVTETLAFEPVERRRRGGRGRTVAALVLIPMILGGGGWAAWQYLGDLFVVEDPYDVPLVRADPGPVKVRPENPGGMQVPDQDKLVYNRMRGDDKPPQVERLLPRPESPLPPPTAILPPTAPPTPPPAESAPPSPKSAPAVPSTEEVLAAKPPAPAPAPPSPPAAPKPAGTGEFRVQLAAVRSPEQARGEWERLRRKNADLLGKLGLFITKADLGPGKGIYFRLRAGPLAGAAKAKALCASLAERKIGCLVIRPEG